MQLTHGSIPCRLLDIQISFVYYMYDEKSISLKQLMRDSGCVCSFIGVQEVSLDSSILPHKAIMTTSKCISNVGDFVKITSFRVCGIPL